MDYFLFNFIQEESEWKRVVFEAWSNFMVKFSDSITLENTNGGAMSEKLGA